MHLTFRTASEEETIALGATLAGVLRAGDIVAIDGELGAGKTRLVRGIAEGLGVDPGLVSSPTYVFVHEYPAANPLSPPLIHVDAYRLSGPADLDSIGWDRVMDAGAVVAIEWAARIAAALTQEPTLVRVHIEETGSAERKITLLAPPAWGARPGVSRLAALAEEGDGVGKAACPVCRVSVGAGGAWAPFCSEKCRMADLGKWLTGRYVVSRGLEEGDLDNPDLETPGAR